MRYTEILKVRMDKKLKKQLIKYAKRNDAGLVSVSARKALTLFIKENLEAQR